MTNFKKIDHLGIAVANLQSAVQKYEVLLQTKPSHFEEVVEQKVKTAFFELGESHIELLEATSEESPIAKYLSKNPKGGIHHICIEVEDIEQALKDYQTAGIRLIDQQPRLGAHDKLVAFVHPADTNGVLIELSQSRKH
jgi:methylmalonyl-CoA/ethylmalonyl-CoA epimerase